MATVGRRRSLRTACSTGLRGRLRVVRRWWRFAVSWPRRFRVGCTSPTTTCLRWTGDTCEHKCFLDFKVPSPDGSVASVLLGYEDIVVKVDGEWLFKRRDVVSVTGYEQSLPD